MKTSTDKDTIADRYGKKGKANSVDAHVGGRLRIRRTLLGISQEKLADAVGLTFQQVQKYERGTNRVSASRLFQFGKVLEIPVSYFFEQYKDERDIATTGFSDNDQEEFVDDSRMHNKETLDLIRVYYSVSDAKSRKDMMKILKSMADKMK